MGVRRIPPIPPPLPQGDEYARLPVYADGPYYATTGPRDVAKFLGPPSKFVDVPDPPNP